MIYALYISCIFAPFVTPHSVCKPHFCVCVCVCVCVLQDCSREQFDARSQLGKSQFTSTRYRKAQL